MPSSSFIADLSYGDLGPHGATKRKTPHLDRMAREGMKLLSRAGLLGVARANAHGLLRRAGVRAGRLLPRHANV